MSIEIKVTLIVVGIFGFVYFINWLDRNVFNRRK
mgnify:CR=1 FL=1